MSTTSCCSPATAISARWSRPCSARACASPSSRPISTQPPMVADELRRQADNFIDLVELQPKIGRDPCASARRATAGARAGARPRRTPQFLQRRRAATRGAARFDDDESGSARMRAARPSRRATARSARASSPSARNGAARDPDWFNAPVPTFGPIDARLLIVGLAPGLRGANRTGRPFTGDYAGDLLYATLIEFGFARGDYDARPDDGLDARRRAHHQRRALRAAGEQADARRDRAPAASSSPPTIAAMPKLRAIVALGRIAHERRCARSAAAARRRAVRARRAARGRAASRSSTAITARATTRTPAC